MRLTREYAYDEARCVRALLRLLKDRAAFVRDDDLDGKQRAYLREFLTPRRALDGALVYPLDEIEVDAPDALQREARADDADAEPAAELPPNTERSDPRAGYRARATGTADPIERAVAQRQLAQLERATNRPAASKLPPSRWAHVPLGELFEQVGNRLHRRADGRFECGHEPVHSSKSGRCVLIDPTAGRWYCRSCRRGGDAATLVMQLRGWTYRQAAAWLAARYGPPAEPGSRGHRKTQAWIEVWL